MKGKQVRMNRIMDSNTGRTVIVPMDHGVSAGPIAGLTRIREAVSKASEGGANAVIVHKGVMAKGYRGNGSSLGFIVHLSCSTSFSADPNTKTLVCTVEEAIRLGADAVSVHVNIGNGQEKAMLSDLATVAEVASGWGVPLLAMIYPRGERIRDEYDPQMIRHAARLGSELGADIVKVSYTGTPDSFREVTEGCDVPVVIAGGPKMNSDRDILEMVKGAMEAGASGTSIGRNIFQHENPAGMVRAICMMVHGERSVEEALASLGACRNTAMLEAAGKCRDARHAKP